MEKQAGRSGEKAGGLLNVSRRSVVHAAKVLRQGCEKLIAHVDAGELAVSAAARLASLAPPDQEKVLAERAQLNPKMRSPATGAVFPRLAAPLRRPCPGAFGVLGKDAGKDRMLLWVEKRALSFTINTLKRRALRCLQ